jgi:hypothetical protein
MVRDLTNPLTREMRRYWLEWPPDKKVWLLRPIADQETTSTVVSPLRSRMIDDMMLRDLSPATQRSYLHAVTKFSRHFGRSPDRLELEDAPAFQVYLASKGISWPSLNQAVCALRFFYGVTLNRGEIPERIAYARTPRKLLAILSPPS